MRTNPRAVTFCLVIFALMLAGVSCSTARPAPAKRASLESAPAKDAAPDISVGGNGFSFTLPDPKRPGKLLYDLRAVSAAGQSASDGFHGTLTSVWAKLFQDGIATAVLTAPRAAGGTASKSTVITGTGGVTVKSLTEPGTVMKADTVVWYATRNKMVATGHVFYHNGQNGATMRGPRAVGDSRLKTLTISGGHGTMNL